MKRSTFLSTAGLLLAAYVAVPLALGGNQYVMSMVVAALIIGGVAMSWALLGNLGGMVSFGHAAFFGVGAYVSALTTVKLGVPVFAAMLLGGAGAAIPAGGEPAPQGRHQHQADAEENHFAAHAEKRTDLDAFLQPAR